MSLSALLVLAALGGPSALPPVVAGEVRVLLVRHAQAFSNLRPQPEMSEEELDRLTALGRDQARDLAGALMQAPPTLILSSPARRARQTADIVAATLGVPVHDEPGLRPIDLGSAPDGLPLDVAARFAAWDRGDDPSPPGGESLAELGVRVLELVRALRNAHAGQTVLAVAHSEVVAALVGHLRATPSARRLELKIPNASITIIESRGDDLPIELLVAWTPEERDPASMR